MKYLQSSFNLENPELVSAIDDLCIWAAPFGIKLIETVDFKSNIKLLDVGCGTGFPLLELSQRLGPTCQAIGLDPWKNAHKRTSLKIKEMGITNVELVVGAAESMPFEDNTFDLVVSNNGLNNVENEKASYSECFRVCKPNGQFVFTFNLPESFIEFYTIYEKLLADKEMFAELNKMKEHIHHKRKTVEETKQMVFNAGFKVKSADIYSFVWRYTDGTAMFNNPFIKLAFLKPWYSILQEKDRELIFEELEKRLNTEANKKGLLCVTIPFAVFNCRKH